MRISDWSSDVCASDICAVGWDLPGPRRQGLATAALCEAERRFIDVEIRFHRLAVVDRHFPEAHDLTHDLGVVTLRFGFVIDVAAIVADTLFLFLQPLDALDEKLGRASCGERVCQ